ncbi:MAG TPA: MFS transporter, partial [Clostridia bacterium]|nr:MFS transporter [Clostridia bacterium]
CRTKLNSVMGELWLDKANEGHYRQVNSKLAILIPFIGMFLTVWTNTSIKIMLPDIMNEFQVQVNWLAWLVNTYSLPYAILMPLAGKLGDTFGAKRYFIAGLFALSLGSIVIFASTTFAVVLTGRLLQGIGAAFVYTNGLIIVLEMVLKSGKGSILGLWSGSAAAGGVAGPVIAGFLLELTHWRNVFLFVALLVVLLLVATCLVVREKATVRADAFDVMGSVTLVSGITILLLSISISPDKGFLNTTVLVMGFLGFFMLYVFYHIEKTSHAPMIQISLFKNRVFTVSMVCGFITNFTIAGTIFIMPIFLEVVQGYSPSKVALLLTPVAFSAAIIGPFSGWVSDRLGFVLPVGAGMLLRGFSFVFLGFLTPTTPYTLVSLYLLINGIGLGLNTAPILNAALSVSKVGDYGITAGAYSMAQYVGGAVGVSISSVIMYKGYVNVVLDSLTGPVPGFCDAFLLLAVLSGAGLMASLFLRPQKPVSRLQGKT